MVQLLQGQLKASQKDFSGAIELFTKGMAKSRHKPDILIEMVGALADVQYKAGSEEDALKTLDNFAEDTQMPVDLRCEALLQQAMIMREMGRTRPALLTENRAVELANSPQLKREIQNVVDQLRKKDE
jgi:hypothetical protein